MNEVILTTSMPDEDGIGGKRGEERESSDNLLHEKRKRETRCDAADIKRTRYGAEVAITTATCSLARGEITKEHVAALRNVARCSVSNSRNNNAAAATTIPR